MRGRSPALCGWFVLAIIILSVVVFLFSSYPQEPPHGITEESSQPIISTKMELWSNYIFTERLSNEFGVDYANHVSGTGSWNDPFILKDCTFYTHFALSYCSNIIFQNVRFEIAPIDPIEAFMNVHSCTNITFIDCVWLPRDNYDPNYYLKIGYSENFFFQNCSFSTESTENLATRLISIEHIDNITFMESFFDGDYILQSSFCREFFFINNTVITNYYLPISLTFNHNNSIYWNQFHFIDAEIFSQRGLSIQNSNVSVYGYYNGFLLGNYYSDYTYYNFPHSSNDITYRYPYTFSITDAPIGSTLGNIYDPSNLTGDPYPLITTTFIVPNTFDLTQPADILYYVNDITSRQLTWFPFTDVFYGVTNYNVTVNGNYLGGHYNKRWYSGTPIQVDVGDFPYGNHSLIIRISNGFGELSDQVWVNVSYPVFFNDNPRIYPDITIEPIEANGKLAILSFWSTDPASKILQWQLKDAILGENAHYNISIGDPTNPLSEYKEVAWKSGEYVTIDVTDVDTGIYLYILNVTDGYGAYDWYEVIVWKYDALTQNIRPQFTGRLPYDLWFYENGELDFSLVWRILDDPNYDQTYGRQYDVYCSITGIDGEYFIAQSGYWGNTVPIQFDLDGYYRETREYWYYVNVTDNIADPIISPVVYVQVSYLPDNTDPAFIYTPQQYYLYYDTEPKSLLTWKAVDLTTNNPYYKIWYRLPNEPEDAEWKLYGESVWSHNVPFSLNLDVYMANLEVAHGYYPYGLHTILLNASDGFFKNLSFAFEFTIRQNFPIQVTRNPVYLPKTIIYDTEPTQALLWTLIDNTVRNQKYSITRDGSETVNTTWFSGINIQYAVLSPTFLVGVDYNMNFYAKDGVGLDYSKSFIFRKELNTAPQLTSVYDFSTAVIFDTEFAYFTLCTIIDSSARFGYYILQQDGITIQFNAWSTGDKVSVYMNRLSLGEHIYNLTVFDGVGLQTNYIWTVFIRSVAELPPFNPLDPATWGWLGWSLLIGSTLGIIGLTIWRISYSRKLINIRLNFEQELEKALQKRAIEQPVLQSTGSISTPSRSTRSSEEVFGFKNKRNFFQT